MKVMGARTKLPGSLVLIVVVALAPVAGVLCDTLCAPGALAAHSPACHEPGSSGDRLDSGSHACPESHAAVQTSQALVTSSRGLVVDLAPAALDLVLRSPILLAGLRAASPPGTGLPLPPSTLVSPILRI